jgi:hypothetical protein
MVTSMITVTIRRDAWGFVVLEDDDFALTLPANNLSEALAIATDIFTLEMAV